ncbi:SNF2 family N-terminal domain-containing protein [Kalaharituber pfeilii]|nr:SNF2 family N-terminal domain-containing protein [Kalaharituber pfeilii]
MVGPLDLEKAIGFQAVDQEALERNVALQASRAIKEKEDELDNKRLAKARTEKDKLLYQLGRLHDRLEKRTTEPDEKHHINEQIESISKKIVRLDRDIESINDRIRDRNQSEAENEALNPVSSGRRPNESQREFLIRTGKITPFAKVPANEEEDVEVPRRQSTMDELMSHQNLRVPGFAPEHAFEEETETSQPKKRRRLRKAAGVGVKGKEAREDDEDYDAESAVDEDDEEMELEEFEDDYSEAEERRRRKSKKRKTVTENRSEEIGALDDGNEKQYQARLKRWIEGRKKAREKAQKKDRGQAARVPEWMMPHPTISDYVLDNDYRMPGDIYPSLFDYQKTCVQWLWELHQQDVGGIIGDEMGLGKTIQIISFLAGLHYSGKLNKPVIVVAPATVLKQWVNEFHKWWPPLRVPILHSSGSGMLSVHDEVDMDDMLEQGHEVAVNNRHGPAAERLVKRVFEKGHVLVTTYAGLQTYGSLLLSREWSYAILDEGHKIRNPDAGISLACKQFKTPHRIILSGTPLQNNLTELWSLFDFIYPGRLGVLPVFQSSFAIPIRIGGYANATNVQIQTGYQCACVLRDLIGPYLLRRLKVDVAADLPKKVEQVLFCKLTKVQRDCYEEFLKSSELKSILDGKRQVLYGVDILRKICNHPDLVDRDKLIHKEGYQYGKGNKSGKMQVVKALLELWKKEGHRTLVFSQTRQMLDILESFMQKIGNYKYLRMDGVTAISHRQVLVDQFNNTPEIDIFLLTTKVGGLGVNLTGADRVIIYDPDWNPSTDVQARERAWRLGQKKDVTIYRLMTAGTIEEKIYHRQIFKQFLTNKILKDPKQRRFFKMNDLHDLFTLGSADGVGGTETGSMFKGAEKSIQKTRDTDDDPEKLVKFGGVAGLATYTTPEGEDENGGEDSEKKKNKESSNDDEANKSDDVRILEGILGKSGVHSALEHDTIMEAVRPEDVLVKKEAKKVVDAAAAALKASRKLAVKAAIGTPTWTGKFGSAGRPRSWIGTAPGPSSSTLLENLKHRRGEGSSNSRTVNYTGNSTARSTLSTLPLRSPDPGPGRATPCIPGTATGFTPHAPHAPHTPAVATTPRSPRRQACMEKLKEYLVSRGGQATNQDVIKAFEGQSREEGWSMDELRGLLKEIAVYGNLTKVWKVRGE